MPSGYTSGVYEGKVTDAKEFILTCARAFGATILMRDEPLDTPIPEFQPDKHYKDMLDKSKVKLEQLHNMTEKEILENIEFEYKNKVEDNTKYYNEKLQIKQRYEDMLAKVEQWEPPTEDHVKLKEYCLSQLNDSLSWDCRVVEDYNPENVTRQTSEEWLEKNIASCEWDIEYYTKEWDKEVKRTNERNLWIKQLRDSLK